MIFIFSSRTMKRYVRPISFLPVRLACPISSKVRGTPHCLQAAYREAAATPSIERPLINRFSTAFL